MRYDLSKVGEIHHSFDAVLVKITDLHSREHMKIMENCEIINASSRQELSFTKPDHLSPSHPLIISFLFCLHPGKTQVRLNKA